MTREEAIKIVWSATVWTDEEREALAMLIPELADNEDERIRKHIIDIIKDNAKSKCIPCDAEIAYLEKQNEPVVDKEGMYYYLGGKFIYCGYPATEENPYDFAMSQQEKQKEQKPAEKQDYSGLNDLERAIHRGFLCAGVENVPVTIINETAKECLKQMKSALSEEDEIMIGSLINYFEGDALDCSLDSVVNWLKSLRPQPKQNDVITPNKEFFQWIYDRLVNVHNEDPNVDYMISFKKRIEELSFNEPSWKPSEEQIKAVEHAYNSFPNDCPTKSNLRHLFFDLKKLR